LVLIIIWVNFLFHFDIILIARKYKKFNMERKNDYFPVFLQFFLRRDKIFNYDF